MDCGAMNNKNWLEGEVKHRMKKFLQLWQHKQKGMVYMISPVTYVQLKEDRKGTQKEVLEAAKEEDINTFTVTTLTVTTPTTRLASPPRANHMANNTVD